jgi:myosin heavy subunit
LLSEAEHEVEKQVAAPVRSRRVGEGVGGSKKRAPTMAQQFKKQVLSLMETLNATEPHFIRCLKPNEEKKADLWDEKRMHEQVVFNGIPENVRIAQAGFVWRMSWENFIDRYKFLSPRTRPQVAEGCTLDKACTFICEDAELLNSQYVVGKRSKVFIKYHAVVDQLELKRTEALSEIIVPITKIYRGRHQRRKYLLMRKAAQTIIQKYKCRFLTRSLIKKRKAMKHVQPLVRGFVSRRRVKILRAQAGAARILTTFAQGWVARKRFPNEYRDRIKAAGVAVTVRRRRMLQGALFLQTLFRMFKWRKAYLRQRRATIKIQVCTNSLISPNVGKLNV